MGFETLWRAEKHTKKMMNVSKSQLSLSITGFWSGKEVSAQEFLFFWTTY